MAIIELSSELDLNQPAPVRILIPAGMVLPTGGLHLREEGGSLVAPAQRDGDQVIAVLSGLKAGQKRRFRLEQGTAASGVTLKEEGPHALAILLPEGPFTTYNFDPAIARPFFYPVLGPGGKMVTRSYPMKKDVPGETKDHPHHRSLWTAYGEVNDVDDWSEAPGKHGWIKHQKFESRADGPVFGGFTATAVWTSADGKPVLDERRSIRVYNVGADRRLLDYEVSLIATYEDIHYGDTKEGGILSVRVATSMDGNKGGRMENSNDGVGEKQCWGKRAQWLDYSGPVEGQTLGIGMMDHPGNFHHPCYWHARDYGLVGTNPFAKAAFEGGQPTGSHQKKGESLRFRYRVLIHKGNADEGRVEDAYHAWVQAPSARVVG
jgi:methane monooxygenase PmoA-like